MARKKRVGRPRKKTSGGRTRAVHGLANIPTSKLRAELDRRREAVGDIQRNRDQLIAQLQDIERTLSDLGAGDAGAGGFVRKRGPGRPPGSGKRGPGRPPGSTNRGPGRPPGRPAKPVGGRRHRNEMNLVDALANSLKGKTLSVSEVSEEVQRSGYKTTSPNFRTIVNQALLSNPKVFRKVARGQYTAK
jgi:hypothetical protein